MQHTRAVKKCAARAPERPTRRAGGIQGRQGLQALRDLANDQTSLMPRSEAMSMTKRYFTSERSMRS